jgi:hypothetical protein
LVEIPGYGKGGCKLIQFSCTKCKHEYRVPDEYAGKKARCKKCENVNVIPDLQPVADFSHESYDSGAEFHDVFEELLRWEKQAPPAEVD